MDIDNMAANGPVGGLGSEHIKDTSTATFMADVVEASTTTPTTTKKWRCGISRMSRRYFSILCRILAICQSATTPTSSVLSICIIIFIITLQRAKPFVNIIITVNLQQGFLGSS